MSPNDLAAAVLHLVVVSTDSTLLSKPLTFPEALAAPVEKELVPVGDLGLGD